MPMEDSKDKLESVGSTGPFIIYGNKVATMNKSIGIDIKIYQFKKKIKEIKNEIVKKS